MKNSYFMILCLLLTSLLACSTNLSSPPTPADSSEEPMAETPSPRMIQPGEMTVAMGSLKISDTSSKDEVDDYCEDYNCSFVYDMCRVMEPFAVSLVIVEYESRSFFSVDQDDCSDHHRTSYNRMKFKTLGVVAGVEVPEELTVTIYYWGQHGRIPLPGETFLISLYEVNGEWFAAGDYTAAIGEDVVLEDVDPGSEYTVILDIPMSFEGLVEEAEAVLADYEPCRSRAWPFWTSRQKVHDFLATSGPRCGGPTFPEDPAYPETMPSPNDPGEDGK